MTIKLLTTGIALFLSCIATAQNFEVPTLPTTKEEFIKSEPDIINVANRHLNNILPALFERINIFHS